MLKELQDFGLSEKEAQVYLATMELAKATVQQIAQKSKVNRATTYVQLDSLKERGLISQVNQGTKTFFVAERPEKVKKLIEKEKSEVLFKESEFNKILPDLKAIYNAQKDRPNVRFYEGEEGLDSYREELLRNPQEFMYSIILLKKDFEAIYEKTIIKISSKVKDYRMLYACSTNLEVLEKLQKQLKSFKIKKVNLDIKSEIVIIPNRVLISNSHGKPLAVVIEDPIMAQTFKQVYEMFWSLIK